MWKLEPQKDTNGNDVGIGGLAVGWLKEFTNSGKPLTFPGTNIQVSALVDMKRGQMLVDYLNGDWGNLSTALEERIEQPYLDMERIPKA